jgi:hypothetical protein
MKALTQDEALLRKALERSTINIVDDRIKPNIKAAGRSTIILREIPSDTAEAEVREIFNFEGCKQITSMRSDIGDTWWVIDIVNERKLLCRSWKRAVHCAFL